MAGPVAAQETITLGVSSPITGAVAYGSLQERRGLELALGEINDAGGVLGKKLRLVFEDNQCNPSVSVTVATKLIESGVPAVLGCQCSSAVLAAMPVFQKAQVPLVSSIATNPAISEKSGVGGNPWVFRLNPSDKELAIANVNYLASLGSVRKIAIVAESTDYGRGGATAFSAAAQAKGLSIVSTDYHQIGTPDFTTVLARLRTNGADAIALYHSHADTANFVRQARAQGVTATLTGKMTFSGDAAEALVAAGTFDGAVTAYPYSAMVETPKNKDFVEKVLAAYKETPTYETFAGYEAMLVLADAIKRAGKAEPQAIRDASHGRSSPR
jgi:branched-chain amino acid transport system substrate-binding protein